MADEIFPIYQRITYWVQNYGMGEVNDQRAVENFIECETREAVNMLRHELQLIVEGKFKEEILDKLVGVKRKVKYGPYQEWAKLMLLWIAGYKG
ncbi:MAG: hypothetical protein K1X79_11400 [Oligoflexia bacterium]|nr:hypothetical protein [Oligoflexia bacterium]